MTAVAGGRVDLVVTNGALSTFTAVHVDAPGAAATLETPHSLVTLTATGQRQQLQLEAVFTDGRSTSVLRGLVTFSTSNANVVTVDADGVLTAVGAGTATITARLGDLVQEFTLSVEPRTTANLTSIDIQPLTAPVRSDDVDARARVVVTGTGSLEGLPVTFSANGRQVRGTTSYGGVVLAPLPGLVVAGSNQLTATVINPTTGQPLTDTETVIVERAGQDAEPNDDPASAIALRVDRRLSGTVGGADLRDAFRIDVPAAGTLTASVIFGAASVLGDVRVVFFNATGAELSRTTPSRLEQRVSQAVSAGVTRIAVETTGSAVSYTLEARFVQGPIAIGSVAPQGGAPGTAVSIAGTGFSTDLNKTHVLFGGIRGKVTGVSTTRIDVVVPAAAVDGALRVVSGDQQVAGPTFVVGNAQPRPLAMLIPHSESDIRFDPISGVEVIVNRLSIYLDPTLPRASADALAAAVGATIVGVNAVHGSYTLFFPQVQTLAGLDALRRQIAADPRVVLVVRETMAKAQQVGRIDSRDTSLVYDGSIHVGGAYRSIRLFDAIEAIRGTPQFETTADLRPVHVGVIDSGFKAFLNFDFAFNGTPLVDLFIGDAVTGFFTPSPPKDPNGHGTAVTSVIMALNNNNDISGVLGSLYQNGETPKMRATVYGHGTVARSFSRAFLDQALADMSAIPDLDVLNMSLAGEDIAIDDNFLNERAADRIGLGMFSGRTLITVAAGNFGRQVRMSLPASLSTEFAHVMSVGGTAVDDRDQTNEQLDARAVFPGTDLVDITDIPDLVCLSVETTTTFPLLGPPRTYSRGLEGSSCGPELTIVAPAEDVWVLVNNNNVYDSKAGTSFAAPLVAGAAALLQAIRGNRPAFNAVDLRNILVNTADNISAKFDPGDARKLNLLAAVRTLLPAAVPEAVYIADQELDTGNPNSRGAVVAIQVDPLTGRRDPTVQDTIIPLTVQGATENFVTKRPTELIAAPSGDKVYAVVQTDEPAIGDGLLVISTQSNRARKFIGFNGTTFPATGPPPLAPAPVFAGSLRPGNAFSKDGRLLYVGTGQTITIINTVEDKVVRSYADLPAEYRAMAGSVIGTLGARIATITGLIGTGITIPGGPRHGTAITGLDVSPEGSVLYVAVNTGSGGGQQPGGLLAIDVSLYRDALPDTRGLQSDLTKYFTPITPAVVPMVGAGGLAGGDEPGAVAVDPNGRHVVLDEWRAQLLRVDPSRQPRPVAILLPSGWASPRDVRHDRWPCRAGARRSGGGESGFQSVQRDVPGYPPSGAERVDAGGRAGLHWRLQCQPRIAGLSAAVAIPERRGVRTGSRSRQRRTCGQSVQVPSRLRQAPV